MAVKQTKPKSKAVAPKKVEIALVDMNAAELAEKAKNLRHQISRMTLEIATRKEKNVRSKFNLRKQLARVLTVMNSKRS